MSYVGSILRSRERVMWWRVGGTGAGICVVGSFLQFSRVCCKGTINILVAQMTKMFSEKTKGDFNFSVCLFS